MKKQIWKHTELNELKEVTRNKTSILVGGCFDVIHYGHLSFLKKAKEKGDILIIALESDEFIQKRKKRISVHTQLQRAEILISHEVVDYVVLLPYFENDEEYEKLVVGLEPQIIAVTEGDAQIENKKRFASQVDGEVHIVSSHIPGFSTTQIINHESISRSKIAGTDNPANS